MAKKLIKLSIATVIIAGVVGSSFSTRAYPPFLRKAQKFGAKDCTFCHIQPTGGEGWNDRGNWLIAEKERRKADAVDVEWLAEYKEGAKKDGDENKEGAKKDSDENKEGAKKDSDENKEGAKKDGDEKKENKEEPKKKDKKDGEDSEKKENKEEPKKKEKPDGN